MVVDQWDSLSGLFKSSGKYRGPALVYNLL